MTLDLNIRSLTANDIINMEIPKLHEWYSKNFMRIVPCNIENDTDSQQLAELLSFFSNNFVYFDYMYSILQAYVKELKLDKTKKELSELVMVRRDIVQHFAEQSKFSYNAVSRILTVKMEANYELRMTDSKRM